MDRECVRRLRQVARESGWFCGGTIGAESQRADGAIRADMLVQDRLAIGADGDRDLHAAEAENHRAMHRHIAACQSHADAGERQDQREAERGYGADHPVHGIGLCRAGRNWEATK